jgi:hypothetical protein
MNQHQKAERSELRHTILGIFWVLNFPAVTLVYFFASEFWEKVSILYLVYVSLYANAGTEFGARQASRAVKVAEDSFLKKVWRRLTLRS